MNMKKNFYGVFFLKMVLATSNSIEKIRSLRGSGYLGDVSIVPFSSSFFDAIFVY